MDYGLDLLTRLVTSIHNGIGTEGALSMRQIEGYLKDADRLKELSNCLDFVAPRVGFGMHKTEAPVSHVARYNFIRTQARAAKHILAGHRGSDFYKKRAAPVWKQELEQPSEVIQPDAYRAWTKRTNRYMVVMESGAIEGENLNEDQAVMKAEEVCAMIAGGATWKMEEGEEHNYLIITANEQLDWGDDDDDHDAAMTDWHSDLERDRKETAGAEPYVPHVPAPSRFKVGQMVTVQFDTEGLPAGRYYGKVVETHDSIYLDGIRPDSGVTVELYREECDGESSETYGRPRLAGEQNWGGPEFSPLIDANDKHCTLAEPLTEPESVELAARLPYPAEAMRLREEAAEEARLAGMAGGCAAYNEAMEQSLESYEDGPIDGYDY